MSPRRHVVVAFVMLALLSSVVSAQPTLAPAESLNMQTDLWLHDIFKPTAAPRLIRDISATARQSLDQGDHVRILMKAG